MARWLSLEWVQLKRMIGLGPTTPDTSMEGQIRYSRDGDVDGALYLGKHITGHTYEWTKLSNPALADLSDVTAANPGAIAGKVLAWDGTSAWDDAWVYTETLGPWSENDVPGTATTDMSLLYFNTATTVNQSTNRIRVGRAGYIIGARITSDDARTAGTCTVAVNLNGVSTAFDGGSCALDASRTTQDASIVAPSAGIRLSSGSDTVSAQTITNGWTPTSADVNVTLLVMYDPIS